jgi:hypothetical protein
MGNEVRKKYISQNLIDEIYLNHTTYMHGIMLTRNS